MKPLVVGANGQVGHALLRSLAPLGELVATTRSGLLDDDASRASGAITCERLDLSEPGAIAPLVQHVRPDVVVNAAAYTAVDAARLLDVYRHAHPRA